MSLAGAVTALRGAKDEQRAADLAAWQSAIVAGVKACASVRQADLVKAAEGQKLPINLAWVSLNEVIPDGFACEAWADNEGVLDIEVPRDLARDLATWIEESGMRVGVEYSSAAPVTLHVCIYRAPPTPEELNARAMPEPAPVAPDDGGSVEAEAVEYDDRET